MLEVEYAAIDHLFAKHLLKKEDHPLFTFCKDLMRATREGHLFITKENLPKEIETLLEKEESPIIREGNNYYLRKNHFHEEKLSKLLSQRMKLTQENLHIKAPSILNEGQKKAFSLLNTSPFFLITGGPGSGKSFLAKEMIKAYKTVYPEKKILCTAPTGKALSALAKAHEESTTLHKLLGIKEGFVQPEKKKMLTTDLLIVDECSMISPALFYALFSSLLDTTQLILIGDPHQLPPVSGASIFQDFTKIKKIPQIKLLAPMRSEKKGLLAFAHAIIHNDFSKIETLLHKDNEIHLFPLDSFSKDQRKKGSILLTPFRKGPFGSTHLNEIIRPQKEESIPIMINKNDSVTGLMNGDIGSIEGEIAIFPEKNISLPKLMLPSYEKAFALSIHKSQGSEFDHVSILLPKEASRFPKELFFTAITRAKKSVHLYGSIDTLKELLENHSSSSSNLASKVEKNFIKK